MAWWLPAMAIGSALMGADQARQQQKQQKAQNMAAAAQTEYSPWTGMGAGQVQTGAPSTLGSGLQSGLSGFMAGQSISKGMAESKLAEKAAAEAAAKQQAEEARKLALQSSGSMPGTMNT